MSNQSTESQFINPCIMEGTTLIKWLDTTITSLVVPEGVEEIENKAFLNCTQLTSLTLPLSLRIIGEYAFSGCSSLPHLEIPQGVTTLHDGAFMECKSLISITLPQDLQCMGHKMFEGCKVLTTLTLPKRMNTLGHQCFYGCTSLSWQTLPNTVRFLGDYVFAYCHGLTSFTLPDTVEYLGESMFSCCNSLEKVTILAPLETLPKATFYNCPSLKEVHLPDGITSLKREAFHRCVSLTQIHIPDSVTEMGLNLFQKCTSLTSIHLPSGICEVHMESFANCTSLESVIIPEGVHTLGPFTFQFCSSLQFVELPDSLQHIHNCVFRFCTSLQEIHLPKNLESVGTFTFNDCPALKKIYKEPSTTPCQWDRMALPLISQFDFLDLAVLVNLALWNQYEYCVTYWEEEQHQEITEFLFSQEKWVDYAFSRDFLPLILSLLEHVDTLSLPRLGDYIQRSINRKSTEITAVFLEYRNKHYNPKEVEEYYSHQEMIACGFVLPTLEEFSRWWHFELEEGMVKIIGYRGHKQEEVIPKILADGRVICSFIYDSDLVVSRSLEHLRIEADLWDCDFSFGMYHLKSLVITGMVFTALNCRNCSDLESFTYEGKGHKDLKLIFENCNLVSFNVPDGVTMLLNWSFRNCRKLQAITIPPSVVEIGETTFDGCGNLTIYGTIGSRAETFSLEQGIPFVVLEELTSFLCPDGTEK